jgi:hypothetical protein
MAAGKTGWEDCKGIARAILRDRAARRKIIGRMLMAALLLVIYQLMVRTFGNTNETRKTTERSPKTAAEPSTTSSPPRSRRSNPWASPMLWLTGVLEQASGTAYPTRPADPPDILKGIAGSPYAIRDYFDVCPDYAQDPDKRLDEFKALLDRCRAHGFKVIIDFVPNHVARSYASDVRPELSFGEGDDRSVFFSATTIFTICVIVTPAAARRSSCRPPVCPVAAGLRAGERLRPRDRQQRGFLATLDPRLV